MDNIVDMSEYWATPSLDAVKACVGEAIECGNTSCLKSITISVHVVCDKGTAHEIAMRNPYLHLPEGVQRYVSATSNISFIEPVSFVSDWERRSVWNAAMNRCQDAWLQLIKLGAGIGEAMFVLPDSLAVDVILETNLDGWRTFLRTYSQEPHSQARDIALSLLGGFQKRISVVFDDIVVK